MTGAVAAEAVRRLLQPEPAAGFVVMGVAAAGIAVNGITAGMFASGRKGDLNVRGAYLHMLSDALVAVGVVVAGGLILLTGWSWLDPAASLLISAVIVWGTWSLLRESLNMALDAVPAGIETAEVRAHLLGQDGVTGLHDLHIWAMSTTETALTCHLLMPRGHPGDRALNGICEALNHRFQIGHATLAGGDRRRDRLPPGVGPRHLSAPLARGWLRKAQFTTRGASGRSSEKAGMSTSNWPPSLAMR